ncbi:MAG: glutamate--tRNA ligase family protein [Vicinamibacterales bacterium]
MVVSRYAPAPTGFLHLGHVLNALHVWGLTRAAGGRVLLRIEDHDRQRSRRVFEQAILDDLDWLGFVPDEPTTDEFRAGVCRGRQSDRSRIYEAALERMTAAGLVYACECSRAEIRARSSQAAGGSAAPASPEGERRYSGRCAHKNLPFAAGLGLRVRIEPSAECFVDLRHGLQQQTPSAQCGDLLVRDREGNWTYQFAVTVDDFEQGVSLVIRGDDLLASTGRQIQLARLIGRLTPPRFLHHALIMKSASRKLSKADRDTSVREMRLAGRSPEEVFGLAMAAAGLIGAAGPIERERAEAVVASRYGGAIDPVAPRGDR